MAFRRVVDAAVEPLRTALEAGNWNALRPALTAIPTCADGAQPAISVEKLRVAVDVLIDEVSFSTAFEHAFVVRRALHKVDVASWLVSALRGTHPASPVLRRLALLTEMLATTEEGRSLLGRARVVDVLVKLWRRAPSSPDVVAALATLCAGHIDNVSRMMRSGGVTAAVSVVSALIDRATADVDAVEPSFSAADGSLLSRVLLLIGLAAICTPDSREEARILVPALVRASNVARAARARRPLADAVAALGNVGECWIKEGRGYLIAPDGGMREAAVDAWSTAPRNSGIVSPSAWALCGFYRAHPDADVPPALERLLAKADGRVGSVRALKEMLAGEETTGAQESQPVPETLPATSEPLDAPVAKKAAPKKSPARKSPKSVTESPTEPKQSPSRKRKAVLLGPGRPLPVPKAPKRGRRQSPKRLVVVQVAPPEISDTETEGESCAETPRPTTPMRKVRASPRATPRRKARMSPRTPVRTQTPLTVSPSRVQDVMGAELLLGLAASVSPRRRARNAGRA